MIVITYIVAAIVCFIASTIACWIPLTVMHGLAGNSGSMWEPDPGNELRFNTVHNCGQGFGALLRTIVGLSAALWAFTWFGKEPSVIFFGIVGFFGVTSAVGAKPAFKPFAQLIGSLVGLTIFFLLIW